MTTRIPTTASAVRRVAAVAVVGALALSACTAAPDTASPAASTPVVADAASGDTDAAEGPPSESALAVTPEDVMPPERDEAPPGVDETGEDSAANLAEATPDVDDAALPANPQPDETTETCIDDACVEQPVAGDAQPNPADAASDDVDVSAPPADIEVVTSEEGEWGGAATDDPVAVVDPVEAEAAGHTIADPAQPEPEPTPEPEPEPEQPERSLGDCVERTVLDTPCIDRDAVEQSVLSQQNLVFAGAYLAGDFVVDGTSTVGNHPRDHDAEIHRVTDLSDGILAWQVWRDDWDRRAYEDPSLLGALRPATRGEQPQSLPSHTHGHLPQFTAAVQAWSDWCFFGLEVAVEWPAPYEELPPENSTRYCLVGLHRMSFWLSHLEAPEECVLPKATARLEAIEQRILSRFTPGDSPERQRVGEISRQNDYVDCPNVIYPDPTVVMAPAEHYALLKSYGAGDGITFADFSRNFGVEPTQRHLRLAVIGGIPNFVLWLV